VQFSRQAGTNVSVESVSYIFILNMEAARFPNTSVYSWRYIVLIPEECRLKFVNLADVKL
jgi:hypothetical protein